MTVIGNPELFHMALSHFNEPMLSGFDLMRVIGYGEDDRDCYLILKGRNGNIVWTTCVGGYVFLNCLKGQDKIISTEGEVWDDFYRIDQLLSYNGAPKEEDFILELEYIYKGEK